MAWIPPSGLQDGGGEDYAPRMSMDAATSSKGRKGSEEPSESGSPRQPSADLRKRYEAVKDRIAGAARKAGRRPDDIVLVAVTKNASIDVVRELLALGHQDFGENRVQQLANRSTQIAEYRQRLEDHSESSKGCRLPEPRWHMIGQLQRNKVRKLVDHVRLVHSIDSMRLAEEIQAQGARRDTQIEILIEVNLGEGQKGGIAAPAVRHVVEQMDSMLNIKVRGVMGMAPLTDDESVIRSAFDRCRDVFEDVRKQVGDQGRIDILSMGMSNDLELAIEYGSNVVRVGTALVGEPVVEDAEETPDRD
ncbi:MAG: YggS family pyridoxal phosphate-dependent enzyme [Phycisphaera sp.]|nr:YggS family pyridoxal phosphate-dependent enzyme [Phycisphaera sp.]